MVFDPRNFVLFLFYNVNKEKLFTIEIKKPIFFYFNNIFKTIIKLQKYI